MIGIGHRAAMRVVQRQRVAELVIFWIRKGVPAPLRLRCKRNFLICVRKCLQACYIRCKSKAAIAEAEGSEWINGADDRSMPHDERLPVNSLISARQ